MAAPFADWERAVLAEVQGDLPDCLDPYARIAERTGRTEEEVLGLLRRLKAEGTIRRFGASIRHQRTGWTHNAMVAWKVEEANMDACGEAAARHGNVSHVYYRPSPARDWPYTLYTMVHGRSEAECLAVVEELASMVSLGEHAILRSVKELKKTSMTYFPK
ncbi:MAG: Lrp/AsnC family transcriptional regulator [Desulfovibrio sp.]|jgi:DNA-binding Lrp family transcriptional regulator|nr:Lrp/AsnC family transcriptional regulator [Desulfovibrio sp.]